MRILPAWATEQMQGRLGNLVKPSQRKQKGGRRGIQLSGEDLLDMGRVSGSVGEEVHRPMLWKFRHRGKGSRTGNGSC